MLTGWMGLSEYVFLDLMGWNSLKSQTKMNISATWRGLLVGVYAPPNTPQPESPKENDTEVSISYWSISSGFLLTLVAYINPLFLSTLATWLSTFLSQADYILFLPWSGQDTRRELPASQNTPVLITPPLLPVWLTHLYFLPGQSAFI